MPKKDFIYMEYEMNKIRFLKTVLKNYNAYLVVVGKTSCLKEFLNLSNDLQPNIIFLNVELGEDKNLMSVLKNVLLYNCEIIIISVYSKQAIDRFKVSSYLVNPIQVDVFIDVIKKTYSNFNVPTDKNIDKINSLIALPVSNTIAHVRLNDIIYLEAVGKHTIFYLKDNSSIIVSKNINEFRKKLPEKLFFRIHQKYGVNLNYIKNIYRNQHLYCQLINEISLPVAEKMERKLKMNLSTFSTL